MKSCPSHILWVAPLALCVMTGACTPLAFTAANLPTRFDDMTVVRDRAYGPLPQQKLDIYLPTGATNRPREVIVFFYGGRWSYGEKEQYRFVGSAFTSQGFIVVIPDYRKYPEVRFPAFVEDGAKALAWVHDHIGEVQGNPSRIHVMGHSAGAHIGTLLAADSRYLDAEGKDRSAVIRDVVGLAGPYAFTPDEPDLEDMFGPPANYPNMQVTTFIDGAQPPMLLLYGDEDSVVERYNLERLTQRITERGGCVRPIIYHAVGHTSLLGALSWFNPGSVPVVENILAFLSSCVR